MMQWFDTIFFRLATLKTHTYSQSHILDLNKEPYYVLLRTQIHPTEHNRELCSHIDSENSALTSHTATLFAFPLPPVIKRIVRPLTFSANTKAGFRSAVLMILKFARAELVTSIKKNSFIQYLSESSFHGNQTTSVRLRWIRTMSERRSKDNTHDPVFNGSCVYRQEAES